LAGADVVSCVAAAAAAARYEFKFLLEHRSGHLEWENGNNRTFTVPKTAAEMMVEGNWGSTQVRATPSHGVHTVCRVSSKHSDR
jgi:hypothetical protein